MKILIALTLLGFSIVASANESDGKWTPVVKFNFEDSSYIETLTWVSGNSYAYTSIASEMAEAKVYCTNQVSSKDLLEILNFMYANQKITSDQASAAFKLGLPKRFPCK